MLESINRNNIKFRAKKYLFNICSLENFMIRNLTFIKTILMKGVIDKEEMHRLVEEYQEDAFSILQHLVTESPHRKEEFARLWGDSLGLSYVNLKKTFFQKDVMFKIPQDYAMENKVIAIYQFGHVTTVALSDPTHPFLKEDVAKYLNTPVNVVFSMPDEIEDAIFSQYQSD